MPHAAQLPDINPQKCAVATPAESNQSLEGVEHLTQRPVAPAGGVVVEVSRIRAASVNLGDGSKDR